MRVAVKAKRIDNLETKVTERKNKIVVNYLRRKGYDCNESRNSMIKINNQLKTKGQRVILSTQNEILQKIGAYYTYEANVMVKIVDTITGKEV